MEENRFSAAKTASRVLVTLCDYIEKILRVVAIVALATMVLTILVNVFTRGIGIKIGITWLDELARYLAMLIVSVALPIVLRHGEMVGADFVVTSMSGAAKRSVIIAGKLLILAFLVLFIRSGEIISSHLIKIGELSANLRLPIWIMHALFPFSGVIMIIFTISLTLNDMVTARASSISEGYHDRTREVT